MSDAVEKLLACLDAQTPEKLGDLWGGFALADQIAQAASLIREQAAEVERLRSLLKTADAVITSLAGCGVRSKVPCRSCEVHVKHYRDTVARAALNREDAK